MKHRKRLDLVKAETNVKACGFHLIIRYKQWSTTSLSNAHSLTQWPQLWIIPLRLPNLGERAMKLQLEIVVVGKSTKRFPWNDIFRYLLYSLVEKEVVLPAKSRTKHAVFGRLAREADAVDGIAPFS